jgi:protein TonB
MTGFPRLPLAIALSVGLHGAVAAWVESGLFVTERPSVTVAAGESRIEMVFTEPEVRKPEEAPRPPDPAAIPIRKAQRPEKPRDSEPLSQHPSEGVVWVEPRYLVNPPPVYPRRALLEGREGTVTLIVDIDETGRASSVRVERPSGHAVLNEAALEAVRRWVFNPARRGRRAIPSRSRVPVHFKIVED